MGKSKRKPKKRVSRFTPQRYSKEDRMRATKYAYNRMMEQKRYIKKVYGVDVDVAREVQSCQKDGFDSDMEVYRNLLGVYRGRSQGKI